MNVLNLRMRYTQLLLICLLGISFYTMILSLSSGISQFENKFLNRASLIASFSQLRLTLGDRVFQQAVVGKQGWLEFTGDKNLDDYQNAIPISPEVLQVTQLKLQKLYEELQKRNITLLLVVAPNKATIYPDKLPDEIQKLGQESNLDMFITYLEKYGPPVLIDIRPALLNGRKKQDVYYSTDTHWNSYGAFIGYTEIMKALSKTYPELAPKSIDDFTIQTGQPQIFGITRMIGSTSVLEPPIQLVPRKNNVKWSTFNTDAKLPMQVSTTPEKNLPTLLMYMDSFGMGTKNFISSHFQKATFVQSNSQYADLVSLKFIDIINPDIVVVEIVERFFSNQALDDFLQQLLSEQ